MVVPAARLRRFAAWIAGPSAIGSVNGMPSSITSAPPSTSASRIAAVAPAGSPAVTKETSAGWPGEGGGKAGHIVVRRALCRITSQSIIRDTAIMTATTIVCQYHFSNWKPNLPRFIPRKYRSRLMRF